MPTPTPTFWGNTKVRCVQEGTATIDCIPAVFSNLIDALLIFVGITALILFIIAGLKFMNSAGDSKKLESARNTLTYGFLGFLIVLFAFVIREIIFIVTGVRCIKLFGFGVC